MHSVMCMCVCVCYLLHPPLGELLPSDPPICDVASLRHLCHSKEVTKGSANDTSSTKKGLA